MTRPSLFEWANGVLGSVADTAAMAGDRVLNGACFDETPERRDEGDMDMEMARLEAHGFRSALEMRTSAGFNGMAAWWRLDSSGGSNWLYLDAFDIGGDLENPQRARSIALRVPLKRTFRGKFKVAGQGSLLGESEVEI